jgi:RNA polymerase sigma-70 factor (ECF subfamily)
MADTTGLESGAPPAGLPATRGGPLADDTRFEAMIATHHAEIYRYILRTTGRTVDADDISQETFLRAYRAWRALPADANARAWLFAIATNLCRNHFRARTRRHRAYEAVRATARETDALAPDGIAIGRQMSAAIDAVVARLPFKQRVAFLERKIHGLDYDAIGRSLDCSAESARAHVFQALRKIRQVLDRDVLGEKKGSAGERKESER